MAKLYWAVFKDSDDWTGPHDTVEECLQDARAHDFCDASDLIRAIWIAPVDAEKDDDENFWRAFAAALLLDADRAENRMVEDGWLDPERSWIPDYASDQYHNVASALRAVFPRRPAWRTVDTSKAEKVTL